MALIVERIHAKDVRRIAFQRTGPYIMQSPILLDSVTISVGQYGLYGYRAKTVNGINELQPCRQGYLTTFGV